MKLLLVVALVCFLLGGVSMQRPDCPQQIRRETYTRPIYREVVVSYRQPYTVCCSSWWCWRRCYRYRVAYKKDRRLVRYVMAYRNVFDPPEKCTPGCPCK